MGQVPAFKNLRFVFLFFFFFHKTVKLFPQSIVPGRRRTPPKENKEKKNQHQKISSSGHVGYRQVQDSAIMFSYSL